MGPVGAQGGGEVATDIVLHYAGQIGVCHPAYSREQDVGVSVTLDGIDRQCAKGAVILKPSRVTMHSYTQLHGHAHSTCVGQIA